MTPTLFQAEQPITAEHVSPVSLRPFQQDAIERALAEFETVNSTLIVHPTGSGKTTTAAMIVKHMMSKGRVMIVAHREELIFQAAERIKLICGIEPAIEMAGSWADTGWSRSPVVISTIQTQVSGNDGKGRMARFDPARFSMLWIDEAHHAPADSYRRVVAHYRQNPDLKVLGCTATPDRADEAALGQCFESVAHVYEILDAIHDGWLVPVKVRRVMVDGLDLSDIRTTAGDLNGADLDQVMNYEKALHGIVDPTLALAAGRRTLVFAVSLAHAERLTEIFNRHAPGSANWVHGGTPKDERRQIFADYSAGRFQILVNVGVVTEGVDVPGIEVVAMARPTKSRAVYAQAAGRGLRPLPGLVDGIVGANLRRDAIAASAKPWCEILDFAGVAGRHKLVGPEDILGGNYDDEIVEAVRQRLTETSASVPADVATELEIEKQKREAERQRQAEAARRAGVVAKARWTSREIDPFATFDIEPRREHGWDSGKQISEKMGGLLERNGINWRKLSYAEAGQLCAEIIRRYKTRQATVRQLSVLRRAGWLESPGITADEAGRRITALKANNWSRPADAPQ